MLCIDVEGKLKSWRFIIACALIPACALESEDEIGAEIAAHDFAHIAEGALHPERSITCQKAGEFLPYDEVYYPDVLNAELAESPELRERFGAGEAETCEEARRLAQVRVQLSEEQPSLVVAAAPADEFEDGVNDKFWGGVASDDRSVVGVFTSLGFCSAVAISARHLVTAAHCLQGNNTTCGGAASHNCRLESVTIKKSTGAGTFQTFGPFPAATYRHESYGGLGDPSDDIGLIEVSSLWNQPAADRRPIWLGHPSVDSIRHASAGWGSTTQYSPGNAGTQNQPNGDRSFTVEWVAPDARYYLDDNDDDVDICKGDSGSPTFRKTASGNPLNVQGVSSEIEVVPGRLCRINSGHKERWTNVAAKMSWLEPRIRNAGPCQVGAPQCCLRIHGGQAAQCW